MEPDAQLASIRCHLFGHGEGEVDDPDFVEAEKRLPVRRGAVAPGRSLRRHSMMAMNTHFGMRW